jgi:hypothetical protein
MGASDDEYVLLCSLRDSHAFRVCRPRFRFRASSARAGRSQIDIKMADDLTTRSYGEAMVMRLNVAQLGGYGTKKGKLGLCSLLIGWRSQGTRLGSSLNFLAK